MKYLAHMGGYTDAGEAAAVSGGSSRSVEEQASRFPVR
jgi:hypothetical protein